MPTAAPGNPRKSSPGFWRMRSGLAFAPRLASSRSIIAASLFRRVRCPRRPRRSPPAAIRSIASASRAASGAGVGAKPNCSPRSATSRSCAINPARTALSPPVLGHLPPESRPRRVRRPDGSRGRWPSGPSSSRSRGRARRVLRWGRASRDRCARAPARCGPAPGRPRPHPRSAPAALSPGRASPRVARTPPAISGKAHPAPTRRNALRSGCEPPPAEPPEPPTLSFLIAHLRIRRSGIRRRPAHQRATSMDSQPASLMYCAGGTRHARLAPRRPTSRFVHSHIVGSPVPSVSSAGDEAASAAAPVGPRHPMTPGPTGVGPVLEIRHEGVVADVQRLARPPLVLLAPIEDEPGVARSPGAHRVAALRARARAPPRSRRAARAADRRSSPTRTRPASRPPR